MLNLDLSIRDDGQAVVALRGELNLADTPGVASQLTATVAACGPSVIVDLGALESVGYSGLGVLLRIRKWTRQGGGDLLLAAPQQPVRRILEATGLIDVFSVYPSVDDAAGGARQARPRVPAASQRLHAPTLPRCGERRPLYRTTHSPVRPRRSRGACRSRLTARDTCFKWCSLTRREAAT